MPSKIYGDLDTTGVFKFKIAQQMYCSLCLMNSKHIIITIILSGSRFGCINSGPTMWLNMFPWCIKGGNGPASKMQNLAKCNQLIVRTHSHCHARCRHQSGPTMGVVLYAPDGHGGDLVKRVAIFRLLTFPRERRLGTKVRGTCPTVANRFSQQMAVFVTVSHDHSSGVKKGFQTG